VEDRAQIEGKRADPELLARVKKLLEQPEAAEAEWKQLGPAALPVLEKICRNPATSAEHRARAVDALALVDDPKASLQLKGLVSDAKLGATYRSRAANALAQREGSAAAPSIRPLLSEASPKLRESGIRSLANVGGEDARRSLEERLPREEDGQLRELIQRSLAKLQP
jgi:HEAT repeat protein